MSVEKFIGIVIVIAALVIGVISINFAIPGVEKIELGPEGIRIIKQIDTSTISETPGPSSCSWNNEWCYEFTKVVLSNTKLSEGDSLKVGVEIKPDGTKRVGQMDVVMTITDPVGGKEVKSKRIDTVKGSNERLEFSYLPDELGKYSILFEIIAPERYEEHVFDTHKIQFVVSGNK